MVNNEDKSSPEHMPPLIEAVPLGLQHVLAMFAGNITVPIIIAGVIGSGPEEKAFLLQVALFISGVATLIQTIGFGPIGARLPIVQGTSFGFLPILIPLAKTLGLKAVFGAALVGGLVQVVLGIFLRRLRGLFPPLISGIVVLTIGTLLMGTAIKYMGGGVWLHDNKPEFFATAPHLIVGGVSFLVAIIANQWFKGILSSASVLVGMAVGYVVSIPLGLVNFSAIGNAAWFAFPSPLKFGMEFPLVAVVAMSIMAVVTTIETIGDVSAITMGGANRQPTDKELSGAIVGDGLGTSIAAFFGALPNTSYSQNVGLITFTGVMSRHVVSIGAVFLILFGLCPKFGALVSSLPNAVLGGASIIMFGIIAAAGIKLIAQAELGRRNMLIVGVCLTAGVALPMVPSFTAHLHPDVSLILRTGLVPAAFLALLFNWILPADKKGAELTQSEQAK